MIIDGHCDMLYRVWAEGLDPTNDPNLHVNIDKWRASPVKVQSFALFVPDEVDGYFQAAKEMVDIFHQQVIQPHNDIVPVRSREDIENLKPEERGAFLTLEGVHPIEGNLSKLAYFIDQGVGLVGLTWNNSNEAADSITEENPKGLTDFGFQVVDLLNQEKVWVDVSHLAEPGFWDVLDHADHVIASHSNTHKVYNHQRNLKDDQIKALVKKDALMGLVFYPEFINGKEATIADLKAHLDHYLSLGAGANLCLGSDFDGITQTMADLYDIEQYIKLENFMDKNYPSLSRQIGYQNFLNHLPK